MLWTLFSGSCFVVCELATGQAQSASYFVAAGDAAGDAAGEAAEHLRVQSVALAPVLVSQPVQLRVSICKTEREPVSAGSDSVKRNQHERRRRSDRDLRQHTRRATRTKAVLETLLENNAPASALPGCSKNHDDQDNAGQNE